eukprot:s837_g18.t2
MSPQLQLEKKAAAGVYILAGWSRPSALIGFFVLLSISLAPGSLPERSRFKGFRSRVSEPMKLVGLTPQEITWATEILTDEREHRSEAQLEQEGPRAGLSELRKLQEVVEADDVDALPAAIRAAEVAGVELSELRFAKAVLQQRLELRQSHAKEVLQRLVAHQGDSRDLVKLRASVLLARAYGVHDHDRQAAEDLLKCREAEARRALPSALKAKHQGSKALPGSETIFGNQIGIPRFRQRFWSEDWSHEIQDDVAFAEQTKIQLVLSEFWPPEIEEDQRMITASRNNDWRALEKLLHCPRSPNVRDARGRTPLHHAARNGHLQAMQLLIEAGAEIDVRDTTPKRQTPLLLAALFGHVDCVRFLLESGSHADLTALQRGAAPLHLAAQNGHVQVIQLLIAAGADRNKASTDIGATALFIAAQNGHVEVVRLLIEAGVDYDKATTDDGKTPLHIAAESGHAEVVRLLIEAGVDYDQATRDNGATALHFAAEQGHVELVRLLIEAGGDIDKATMDTGEIPLALWMTAQKNYVEVNDACASRPRLKESSSPRRSELSPHAGDTTVILRQCSGE